MKTRKITQVMTALALVATMTAPVTAFATITPGEPSTFTGENLNQSGTTPINLNVTAGYIVTIPAKIDLIEGDDEVTNGTGTKGDEVYTGKGTISVEDLHLGYGKSLQVSIDETTNFDLTDGGEGKIEYQVSKANGGSALSAGAVITTFNSEEGPSAGDSQEVYFRTAKSVTNAGDFSGNITFTFSVVGDE